jgi:hypothetical protein
MAASPIRDRLRGSGIPCSLCVAGGPHRGAGPLAATRSSKGVHLLALTRETNGGDYWHGWCPEPRRP